MVKHVAFATLLSSLLAVSSGCGLVHSILYGPCGGPYAGAAPCGSCGDDCGPGVCRRTPVRNMIAAARPCGHCGMACGGVCDDGPCGDMCDDGGCGGCGGCVRRGGPLTWLFSIFGCNTYPCSGCGERYWGEWADAGPDCCDSCGGGNYMEGPASGCQNCGHHGPGMAAGVPTVPPPGYGEPVVDDYVPRSARTSHSRHATNGRAQYAPRVLSVNDEVVRSAESHVAAPAPRVAQPRRTMPQ